MKSIATDSFLLLFFLIIIIFVLWLDEIPLLLGSDGVFHGSMTVSLSIVSNDEVPPNLVDEEGGADNVGIVSLMVVGNPDSNESPEGLDSWVSTESGSLLWLSSENWSIPQVSWGQLSSEWRIAFLVKI